MKNYCLIRKEYKGMDAIMHSIFNSPHGLINIINPVFETDPTTKNRHINNLYEDGIIKKITRDGNTSYTLTSKGRLKHMEGGYLSEFYFNQFYKWLKRMFAGIIIIGTVVGIFWTFCELFQPQWIPKYQDKTIQKESQKTEYIIRQREYILNR